MTIGFDGIRTVEGGSEASYYDRLIIASLGMEFPRDTFMVYSPNSSNDRGMSWLLSIANVHNKTPYKAINKWLWRNHNGIYHDLHRHGVKVFHGLDAVLPTGKCKQNVKMVTTVRDLSGKRYVADLSTLEKMFRNSRIGKACKKADRIIATSQYIKQQIIDRYHVPQDKIDVVYTAFRNEYLTSNDDTVYQQNVKGKYNLPSNFILAVTDFSSLTNLETLYRAFAKIDDKKIDLVLIGKKNNYYRRLKRLASQLNIDDRVVRVSSINKHNFMGLYSLAKAVVDPSLQDGIGQCVVEALINGTPIIASDDGCHRELGADAALYFKPSQVEELTAHINTVLGDTAKRETMIANGKKHAAQFTQQHLAQSIMSCYNKALGRE